MRIVIYVISILWIALGTLLILYTNRFREVLKKVIFTDKVRFLAGAPLIFGIALVIGAFYFREMFLLAFILGLLAIIKGIFLAVGPPARIKEILDWWFNRAGEGTVRLFGMIIFILGCALLSYLV